ncbi:DoxX family protein [Lysobacter sp. A6]|uniref:DoxX family protein n=1 Tax=Noviluteimonas lactosilytica TaxID=2888523 RepID=A0ABS8JJI5_9GAMM|nr:DoxX family protein [Lysobacter lactosilyticus]MCC8363699.1 DoxX family protein [Lysobacter lactosilyticus]
MTASTRNPLLAIGRALLGALFFVSAITKIGAFAYVSGWIGSNGLPFPDLVLVATIAIELIGGAMLITGWKARWAALGLAIFLVPVTLVFHAFWSAEPAQFSDQLTAFLKNTAIFGGMLLVFDRSRATAK